jgi:translation initiation factor IF-1
MSQKESFVLDAVLKDVLSNSVFSAELPNGHQIVAFPRRCDEAAAGSLRVGDRIQVEMSPFDMSKGTFVF